MTTRPKFTASDLDVMRKTAIEVRQSFASGEDVSPDDVAVLSRFVVDLVDEIDGYAWRATAASMALDGRLSVKSVEVT